MTSASVVIPTYRRPERLRECLAGLRGQTAPPAEVLVVCHATDGASASLVDALAADWPAVRLLWARGDGAVSAYGRGLAAARHPIVAFIDDDAVPQPDWLERIVDTFQRDARIAGVGGRDIVVMGGEVLTARRRLGWLRGDPPVGRIQWWGRMIANHHLGAGPPRDVDVLKGVNMSFRRAAACEVGFDDRLHGGGAQVHLELSICLPLRRRGLRLVYDPSIVVRHYPAPRQAGAARGESTARAVRDSAHNEALSILDYFDAPGRLVFGVWAVLVGNTDAPGAAVLGRDLVHRRPAAWARFAAAQHGRSEAWLTRRHHARHHPQATGPGRPEPQRPDVIPATNTFKR